MDEPLILDACCTLTLAASGYLEDLLERLPYQFGTVARARREIQYLRIRGSEDREKVEPQPLFDRGLLVEWSPNGPHEEERFVRFAGSMEDGEAEAAAIAVVRGFVLATDERKVRNLLSREHPNLRLHSTLDLVREWQAREAVPAPILATVLREISFRATYRPKRTHPLWGWWHGLVGDIDSL